jgi:hypothetical protein
LQLIAKRDTALIAKCVLCICEIDTTAFISPSRINYFIIMEPVTLTAAAIATLIFSEAFKEGGKALGKGISENLAQLLSAIREKFQTAGTEGIMTRAQENPIEKNTAKFQDELETQMEEDEAFANRLQELMTQLKSNETINQIVIKGVEVKGKAKVGDIDLAATRDGSVNQEAVVDAKFGDDLDLGNVNMKA